MFQTPSPPRVHSVLFYFSVCTTVLLADEAKRSPSDQAVSPPACMHVKPDRQCRPSGLYPSELASLVGEHGRAPSAGTLTARSAGTLTPEKTIVIPLLWEMDVGYSRRNRKGIIINSNIYVLSRGAIVKRTKYCL